MSTQGNSIGDDHLIWYATYGSNLLRGRLDCYIQGGQPAGVANVYPGCRDKASPRDARRVVLPYRLYFAERSESWGGAIAFIRRTISDTSTYGRMFLMTYGQFNDVVRQENGRRVPGSIVVPPFEVLANAGRWEIADYRLYAGIIKIGTRHGHPILSLTAGHESHVVGAPSEAYVKTIVSGLKETYPCMRNSRILAYLGAAEGIREGISKDTLAEWL